MNAHAEDRVDEELQSEIELLGHLMALAARAKGALSQAEIGDALGVPR